MVYLAGVSDCCSFSSSRKSVSIETVRTSFSVQFSSLRDWILGDDMQLEDSSQNTLPEAAAQTRYDHAPFTFTVLNYTITSHISLPTN